MKINHDDQVIPTMSKAGGQPRLGSPDADGNAGNAEGQPEEISPENMKYAEVLIPYFGEETVKKMFSKPWAAREEGLKECEEIVRKNGNDINYFQASLNAASQAMADKISQIIMRGMSLMETTLKANTQQLEPGSSSSAVFNWLLSRLGDNNQKVRQKSEDILMMMANHPSFGPNAVVSNTVKGQIKKAA